MSKPYYNTQKKRWIVVITDKLSLEFQHEWKANDYYEKNKGNV